MTPRKTKLRSFRLRPNTLAALQAAAGNADVSPNRMAEVILRLVLAEWLAERVRVRVQGERQT